MKLCSKKLINQKKNIVPWKGILMNSNKIQNKLFFKKKNKSKTCTILLVQMKSLTCKKLICTQNQCLKCQHKFKGFINSFKNDKLKLKNFNKILKSKDKKSDSYKEEIPQKAK